SDGGSLLRQVQEESRSQEPGADPDEERAPGAQGHLPVVRDRRLQDWRFQVAGGRSGTGRDTAPPWPVGSRAPAGARLSLSFPPPGCPAPYHARDCLLTEPPGVMLLCGVRRKVRNP